MRAVSRYSLFCLTFAAVTQTAAAWAEQLQFHVQDSNGAPLEDAVIMLSGPTPSPSTTPAVMDQLDKTFVPHVLVIEQGRWVSFPNSDDIRHHVYSFSKPKPFELKLYSGSQQAPIQFDKPGIVALGCNIHDTMVGYIVVSDTALFAKTDARGMATLETHGSPTAALRAWHPRLLKGNQAAIDMPLPDANDDGVRHITLTLTAPAVPKPGFGHRFGTHAP